VRLFGMILSNIDAAKGNRGSDRKFADRPVVKERRVTVAVGLKEKSIARRKAERSARQAAYSRVSPP
jgi:hypothetical protein